MTADYSITRGRQRYSLSLPDATFQLRRLRRLSRHQLCPTPPVAVIAAGCLDLPRRRLVAGRDIPVNLTVAPALHLVARGALSPAGCLHLCPHHQSRELLLRQRGCCTRRTTTSARLLRPPDPRWHYRHCDHVGRFPMPVSAGAPVQIIRARWPTAWGRAVVEAACCGRQNGRFSNFFFERRPTDSSTLNVSASSKL